MRAGIGRTTLVLGAGAGLVLSLSGCLGSSSPAKTSDAARQPAGSVVAKPKRAGGDVAAPGGVSRILDATVRHPQLGIEGDTVSVTVPAGHLDAVLVGPQVPESGAAPIPNYSDVLFQLTLTGAGGRIPLAPTDFTVTDELGHVSHPQLIPDQGPITTVGPVPTGTAARSLGTVPAVVSSSHSLVIDIVDPGIATGDGRLSWGPGTGGHVVAAWDFAGEVD